MKYLAQLIFGLLFILGVRYFVRGVFQGVVHQATTNSTSCLALLGSTTSEQDGHTYIVGSVRNNCTRQFSSVTVSFKLDRPRGAMQNFSQAIAYAYTRDLKPSETRSFKSAVPLSKDVTYRFDGFNAY